MDIRDLVSVALTQGERVSLTLDPSPETDPTQRWLVAIGAECRAAGETPENALRVALQELQRRRQKQRMRRLEGRARKRYCQESEYPSGSRYFTAFGQ